MWSPKRFASIAAVIAGSLFLAGCFRPLYGSLEQTPESSSGPGSFSGNDVLPVSLQTRLASIDITVLEGRVPQRVRNELVYAFKTGQSPGLDYKLDLSIQERIEDVIVRRDREPQSQILNLQARFILTDLATGKVVYRGNAVARASFDRSDQIFANERARLDAENRAARVLANSLKTRIAGFLASQD